MAAACFNTVHKAEFDILCSLKFYSLEHVQILLTRSIRGDPFRDGDTILSNQRVDRELCAR